MGRDISVFYEGYNQKTNEWICLNNFTRAVRNTKGLEQIDSAVIDCASYDRNYDLFSFLQGNTSSILCNGEWFLDSEMQEAIIDRNDLISPPLPNKLEYHCFPYPHRDLPKNVSKLVKDYFRPGDSASNYGTSFISLKELFYETEKCPDLKLYSDELFKLVQKYEYLGAVTQFEIISNYGNRYRMIYWFDC